jgi:hypothetical protein
MYATAEQFQAASSVQLPDGSIIQLSNTQLARMLRRAASARVDRAGSYYKSIAVSRWRNGHARMPLCTYELLMAQREMIRLGWATLEELCAGVTIDEVIRRRTQ